MGFAVRVVTHYFKLKMMKMFYTFYVRIHYSEIVRIHYTTYFMYKSYTMSVSKIVRIHCTILYTNSILRTLGKMVTHPILSVTGFNLSQNILYVLPKEIFKHDIYCLAGTVSGYKPRNEYFSH